MFRYETLLLFRSETITDLIYIKILLLKSDYKKLKKHGTFLGIIKN